jgi:hypothetical protein
MRHYDREQFRHLHDAERYRDVDYLGDDVWIGPSETVLHDLRMRGPAHFGEAGPTARRRPDEAVHRDIRARLARHAGAEAEDVGIEVRDGAVTLWGIVEDQRLRYLAEGIANDVIGVSAVRNDLRVRALNDTRIGASRQRTGSSASSVGAGRR